MLSAHVIKRRRDLLVDVSLELAPGGSMALIGVSGAGKSTVLACVAGLEKPDGGYVTFQGTNFFPPSLPVHRRGIGYLTQEPGLFPHLSVRQNVTFGLSSESLRQEDGAGWISVLRDRMELASVWEVSAASISGGQARRVALARMLARKPALVLLDEPFGGLDRKLVRELIEDLIFWNRTLGFSMIVVDHQIEVLRRMCPDGVIAMEAGLIVQRGSWADLYSNPATKLLQSLLAPL